MMWDAFVSHASEDKNDIAKPLSELLRTASFDVWYDDWALLAGDSLRESIEKGLRQSRFGIVVLSPSFIKKKWPRREFDAILTLEQPGTQRLLPIWHQISHSEAEDFSLFSIDRKALPTKLGLEWVATKLADRLATYSVVDHECREHLVDVRGCTYLGYATRPHWIKANPSRISSDWLAERLIRNAYLRIYQDANGIWFVVDRMEGCGVVLCESQFNDIKPTSSTAMSTTTTPGPTSNYT